MKDIFDESELDDVAMCFLGEIWASLDFMTDVFGNCLINKLYKTNLQGRTFNTIFVSIWIVYTMHESVIIEKKGEDSFEVRSRTREGLRAVLKYAGDAQTLGLIELRPHLRNIL